LFAHHTKISYWHITFSENTCAVGNDHFSRPGVIVSAITNQTCSDRLDRGEHTLVMATPTPSVPSVNTATLWLKDLAERVVTTFVEAVVAAYLASGLSINQLVKVGSLEKLGFAGIVAVMALVKGVIAGKIGNKSSASLLR
jgi:hypothetical protein